MPASSPGARLEQLDLEAAPLGPAHLHAQHHLGPVLGVGPARAGVDGDERVAGVVAAGEQALLLERRRRRLDRGERLVELGGQLRVLLGQLDQAVEVLGVAAQPVEGLEPAAAARAYSALTLPARLGVVPEARLRPSGPRARAVRSRSQPGQR